MRRCPNVSITSKLPSWNFMRARVRTRTRVFPQLNKQFYCKLMTLFENTIPKLRITEVNFLKPRVHLVIVAIGISSMLPVTAYGQPTQKYPIVHQAQTFRTPLEWQNYWASYHKGMKQLSVKGMYFIRTSDNIDLTRYSPDQITYEYPYFATLKTKILVLPSGTFIWTKNTGEDFEKH